MSQDDINQAEIENATLSTLFTSVKTTDIEASPYLKTRILAQLNERQLHQRKLNRWRFVAALGLFLFICVPMVTNYFEFNLKTDGFIERSYVIQVDFSHDDLKQITQAEVILPKDIHFVSSDKNVRNEKHLKLPLIVKTDGQVRLPFVVSSKTEGDKEILVRLMDANNNFVREKYLKFKFAKNENKTAF